MCVCVGGGTVQAAYASQVTCSQTCNLQIINVVLISHINSCHFVGMVFTPSSRSLGPVPATSASETARVITLLQSESGVSEEREVAGWFTHTHTNTHRHTCAHTHIHTHNCTKGLLWATQLCDCFFYIHPSIWTPTHKTTTNTMCINICPFFLLCFLHEEIFDIPIKGLIHHQRRMRSSNKMMSSNWG